MLYSTIGSIRRRAVPIVLMDQDVVVYTATVSVWGRWYMWVMGVFMLVNTPHTWYPHNAEYLAVHALLGLQNGVVHYRLHTNRPVTWRWMLFLCAMDLVLITASIAIFGGYGSYLFLAYYPALAIFTVVFSSSWLSMGWATVAAAAYVTVCLSASAGIDPEAGEARSLVARVSAMYLLSVGISFVTRFERSRWRSAVTRERQLREERVELSRTIHNTTAQTAYLIGLGIHRAKELAGGSNEDLASVLEATSELSRSAIWEMRGPIDAGHIVEGRELGQVLWSHCATFEKITGIGARMTQLGTEPPLDTTTRGRLFSIAHNALTNAYLHAAPRAVEVNLDFASGEIVLSVSDDGVGLPDDYAERGRGFSGMSSDAEWLGGKLTVESGGSGGGTTITCVVPRDAGAGAG